MKGDARIILESTSHRELPPPCHAVCPARQQRWWSPFLSVPSGGVMAPTLRRRPAAAAAGRHRAAAKTKSRSGPSGASGHWAPGKRGERAQHLRQCLKEKTAESCSLQEQARQQVTLWFVRAWGLGLHRTPGADEMHGASPLRFSERPCCFASHQLGTAGEVAKQKAEIEKLQRELAAEQRELAAERRPRIDAEGRCHNLQKEADQLREGRFLRAARQLRLRD